MTKTRVERPLPTLAGFLTGPVRVQIRSMDDKAVFLDLPLMNVRVLSPLETFGATWVQNAGKTYIVEGDPRTT